MIYSEKVRHAREQLGMSRMEFAVFLGTSEGHLRNIETAKEGKDIRFSREREAKIIKEAGLPPGFFVDGEVYVKEVGNDMLYYRTFPEDVSSEIDYDEAVDLLRQIAEAKKAQKTQGSK